MKKNKITANWVVWEGEFPLHLLADYTYGDTPVDEEDAAYIRRFEAEMMEKYDRCPVIEALEDEWSCNPYTGMAKCKFTIMRP